MEETNALFSFSSRLSMYTQFARLLLLRERTTKNSHKQKVMRHRQSFPHIPRVIRHDERVADVSGWWSCVHGSCMQIDAVSIETHKREVGSGCFLRKRTI